jgi:hypothetical protein
MQRVHTWFIAVLAAGHLSASVVFEANEGQYLPEVRYCARTKEYDLFLSKEGGMIRPRGHSGTARMSFIGANPAPILTALDRQPGIINYLIGNDESRWRTGIATFGKVRYSDLYPAIDLVYYPAGAAIEYDLVVSPGGSAESIRMCWEGTEGIAISGDGDLVVSVAGSEIVMRRPTIYQDIEGQRVTVPGRYRLESSTQVAFEIAGADPTEPLVIDPVILRYASYVGGDLFDGAFGVALDRERNVYVTGLTHSRDVASPGALQPSLAGAADIYLTKFAPDGRVIYSTYLGGTDTEVGGPFSGDGWNDVELDSEGNVYLTGTTRSRDFPVTPNALQQKFGGGPDDVFVAKLSPDGKRLIYSTYLGGSGEDQARAIAVDPNGSAYVTGRTQSSDFPSRNPFQAKYGGGIDAFVSKVSPDGSDLLFSSFLGGNAVEVGRDIAVDPLGNAYVAGRTVSPNFPATSKAFQTVYGGTGPFGQGDGFAAKISPNGLLMYATFLGGTDGEIAAGIAVDQGHAYVSGITESADFPTTAGSFQPHFAGGASDGFLTKLNPDGSKAIYSTFVGGAGGNEECFGVAVDARGQAHCAGVTFSTVFPTLHAFQASLRGETDGFVLKLDPTGSHLLYSSYLGGSGRENAVRIAVDDIGNAYVVGGTTSADFPVTPSAAKVLRGGNADGLLAIISHVSEIVPGPRRRAVRP